MPREYEGRGESSNVRQSGTQEALQHEVRQPLCLSKTVTRWRRTAKISPSRIMRAHTLYIPLLASSQTFKGVKYVRKQRGTTSSRRKWKYMYVRLWRTVCHARRMDLEWIISISFSFFHLLHNLGSWPSICWEHYWNRCLVIKLFLSWLVFIQTYLRHSYCKNGINAFLEYILLPLGSIARLLKVSIDRLRHAFRQQMFYIVMPFIATKKADNHRLSFAEKPSGRVI